ncbi:phosphatase PAP2 family protein [Leptolyngbya sp. KIOST-1]|uniref:phosphatase PAP2 family protein n=1 Tax=Leptolyngbya sp. KIOST-1 TaxID=1229172 RepID=UPI000564567B|nr:phosphatase PAP2 family protein [Leptolyngbya sp. KIOST-1]
MKRINVRDRFKSFFGYLKTLLTRHYRSLLLLLLGVYLPFQFFGELAEVVWKNQGGFPWDEPILLTIRTMATPQIDTVAIALTQLGVAGGVLPATIIISLLLWQRRQWRSLAYFLTTLVGTAILNLTAKLLLRRVRPSLWESPAPEYDFSFPSGHAMASMAFVAALVILLWGSRWNWVVVGLGSLFVLVIGWTRLYLGVHYPSDIIAGWLASIAWAVGVSLVLKPQLIRVDR